MSGPWLTRTRALRFSLAGLLTVVALNAFGGGYYGMNGAQGVPTEWLAGSPFKDYFIPSSILFIVVGGSCLAGAIALFRNTRRAPRLALACGAVVLGWIGIQVAIIGLVSWLQHAIAIAGVLILGLAGALLRAERTES